MAAVTTTRRSPISSRVNLPFLREKLAILFRTARAPGIDTVSALDRKLGLEGQRSFRQYYRGDRPSGIPGELVSPFLKLFNLKMHELLQPLSSFEWQMESEAHGTTGVSWHDAEILSPRQEISTSGEMRFSWLDRQTELRLVPCSSAGPLALPSGPHAIGSAPQRTRLRSRTPFHLESVQAGDSHPRILGLLEGRELVCFLEPGELPAGPLQQRLPDTLSLEEGPCTLWLLLLGKGPVDDSQVQLLRAEDTRTRRLGAEAIYGAACKQNAGSVAVLRVDLEAQNT
jgi:hypothetical protein